MENQVHCPKCGSTQITADKKGFSGKKAVAGALLTGGVGILAGTLGSNKVKITCLNCGKVFAPGEGKKAPIRTDGGSAKLDALLTDPKFQELNQVDQHVIKLLTQHRKLEAIKYWQKHNIGSTIQVAADHINQLKTEFHIITINQGCGGPAATIILIILTSVYAIGKAIIHFH